MFSSGISSTNSYVSLKVVSSTNHISSPLVALIPIISPIFGDPFSLSSSETDTKVISTSSDQGIKACTAFFLYSFFIIITPNYFLINPFSTMYRMKFIFIAVIIQLVATVVLDSINILVLFFNSTTSGSLTVLLE